MSSIAAIGEHGAVEAFVLGGVAVTTADDAVAVHAAWDRLGADVAVLILSPRAAGILATEREQRPDLLWAVLPA
ncbi:MAG TPA: hypothetical protein VLO10_03635 [Candidatus Deferrimicrobium sp.]|nr:hypothetical protein [Candidatus Deferrimicrobium sp.]